MVDFGRAGGAAGDHRRGCDDDRRHFARRRRYAQRVFVRLRRAVAREPADGRFIGAGAALAGAARVRLPETGQPDQGAAGAVAHPQRQMGAQCDRADRAFDRGGIGGTGEAAKKQRAGDGKCIRKR